MKGRESERVSRVPRPFPGFGTNNVRYSSAEAERGKMTSTEAGYLYSDKEGQQGLNDQERDQGGSIFIGRFL